MKNIEETARQRKKESQKVENELNEPNDIEKVEEKEEKPPKKKKNFRYYFNRFRYYHYYCSEKIQTFIGVVCMWIIKIEFYLLGYKIDGLPSIHEMEESPLNSENSGN